MTPDTVTLRVSTLNCIFGQYDETMTQILLYLQSGELDEIQHLAFNARDFIEQYCGLAP